MALDELSPDLAPFARDLVDAAGVAGLQPRITSTVRTRSQQGRLYRGYLANPGRAYPVAPPGYSAHEYGEAFDLVVTPMDRTRQFYPLRASLLSCVGLPRHPYLCSQERHCGAGRVSEGIGSPIGPEIAC